jgi:hypothetical protein
MGRKAFRIEWDLRELGPRPARPEQPPPAAYRDIASRLDFSRLDLGRAVAAGYVPANASRAREEQAA